MDLAVVGAGTMGAGIAQVALERGLTVTLYDAFPAAVERGVGRARAGLDRSVERGRLTMRGRDDALARLATTTTLDDLAPAPFVVEAAPEDLALKRGIFEALDHLCSAETVLATNTSSLSVTKVAAAASRPARVAGMHFFNPVPAMALVEVVAGHMTAEETVAAVMAMAERLGKRPVRAKDTPGFIVNRVARPFYGESLRVLAEGVEVPTIDRIMRAGGNFKIGPFELMDLIGIDVNFAVTKSVYEQFFGEPRYRPHPIQERMVDAGTLGRKTGRGFYNYEDAARAPGSAGVPPTPTGSAGVPPTPTGSAGVPPTPASSGMPAPGPSGGAAMPGGRILVAGSPGDPLLEWMLGRLREEGYEPALLAPEAGAPGTPGAMPLSLAPVVAGLDLWRVAGEARFEAVAALDERLPPGRPLLALCHAISIDEVASYAVRGERVVGVSFFGPPRAGMLAEVLPGLGTETGAVARAQAFLSGLGFAVETLPPGAWAVYPRVLSMIVNEAAVAVAEGVAAPADIDVALALGAGYAQGPLALADEIGLGEVLAVLEALHAEYGDDRYRPAPLLRRLVLAGYTGKAAGRGFHLHP